MGTHPGEAMQGLVAGQPGGSRNSLSPGQGASHQRWARLGCWPEGGPVSMGSAARHIAVEQRELKLRQKPRQKPQLKIVFSGPEASCGCGRPTESESLWPGSLNVPLSAVPALSCPQNLAGKPLGAEMLSGHLLLTLGKLPRFISFKNAYFQ